MYFVSDVDITLEDLHGNSQDFKAGVPQIAHPSIAHVAPAYGVRPCLAPDPAVVSGEEVARAAALEAEMRALMATGDPKMFGASGAPHLSVLKKALGYAVTEAERDAAWEAVKAEA